MPNVITRILISVSAVLLLVTDSVSGQNELTFETFALSGQLAPVSEPIESFDEFGGPAINDSGQITFRATLTGLESRNEGIFTGITDALELIARKGNLAPDFIGDVSISAFGFPLLDNSGNTVFDCLVEGTGVNPPNDHVVYSDASGLLQTVAVEGASAPEAGAGVLFDTFALQTRIYRLSAGGHIKFIARLKGAGTDNNNDCALYAQGPGSLNLIYKEGDAIPGEVGLTFNNTNYLAINSLGQTLISDTDAGLFIESGGLIETVVLRDSPVPGAPRGTNFIFFSPLCINNSMDIAFRADLTGGSFGIYSNRTGSLQPVALTGADAPGIPLSGNFEQFIGQLVMNGEGEVAFVASLEGFGVDETNDQAVFAETDGTLELVARKGFPAPGTADGVDFHEFESLSYNSVGQAVFKATLIGPGIINGVNDEAIYTRLNGQLIIVARKGSFFDVNDDPEVNELRFVNGLILGTGSSDTGSGGEDGRRVSLNDAGQLAFQLSFTDGTNGIFIASPNITIGDLTGDGVVDLLDVDPFVQALAAGMYIVAADTNEDGNVNLLDIGPFVNLISTN